MAEGTPAIPGPFRVFPQSDGTSVSWYMVEFDRKGRVKTPDTRAALLSDVAAGGYTDVFLFCHGWNNSWDDAVRNYEAFIAGYQGLQAEQRLALSRPYRPLLIGIYWPSAILMTDEESGPSLRSLEAPDPEIAERQALEELAAELPDDAVDRFRELAGQETLEGEEAQELAQLLQPVFQGADEEVDPRPPPTPDELVALWSEGQRLLGILVRARDTLRQATVWLMKDRAGRVGRDGLSPLLADLMRSAPQARLHLVGHSFGCRALLAAICADPPPRPVTSLLLLQAAINHLCFAIDPAGNGRPGGFRPALERVEEPILATFSKNDQSLTRFFQLALRRAGDLGEMEFVPRGLSPFAALGGYGPGGCGDECELISVHPVGQRYDLGAGRRRLFGVDGTAAISSHSDVSNPAMWWALWCQVSQS